MDRWGRPILMIALTALLWVYAIPAGIEARHWAWDQTRDVRFRGDIDNAVSWGTRVVENAASIPTDAPADSLRARYGPLWTAYRNLYGQVSDNHPAGRYHLDYPPLRLLIATLWAQHIRSLPGPPRQPWDDEAIAPMLQLNLALELVSVLVGALLVFYWARQDQLSRDRFTPSRARLLANWYRASFGINPRHPAPNTPLLPASSFILHPSSFLYANLAALFIWFNPAVIVNAHAWPQWDTWVIPFYLLAALLISTDWALCAGLPIAVGCMMKGQLLLGAPILILWPIFQGRWSTAARFLIGFFLGVGLLASPWIVPSSAAWLYVASLAIAATIASPLLFKRTAAGLPMRIWALCAAAAGILIVWPALHSGGLDSLLPLLLVAGIIIAVPWLCPRLKWRFWLAFVVAGGLFMSSILFDGGYAWYRIGFGYGTEHWLQMTMGTTYNVAALMRGYWGWQLKDVTDIAWAIEILRPILLWSLRFIVIALLVALAAKLIRCLLKRPLGRAMVIGGVGFDALILAGIAGFYLITLLGNAMADCGQPTVQHLLRWIYVIALVLCAVGAARNARRGSARTLLAIAAPWLVFYAILPQMHERYLVYAAAITAIGVGVSSGYALLSVLIACVAVLPMAHTMLNMNPSYWPKLLEFLRALNPGLGWMVVLIAAIYLYGALTTGVRPCLQSKIKNQKSKMGS